MPWQVYKPRNPKKPKKTTFGWSKGRWVNPTHPAGWQQIYGTRGITSTPDGGRSVVSGGSASAVPNATDASSSPGYDPYPGFYDPYTQMLSQLAGLKDQSLSQLRSNLTGRESAINKLYADQVPLVEKNYTTAENAAAATNDAVHNALQDESGTAKSDLLSKLAVVNGPQGANDKAVKDVTSYYSGLGNANYAMDAGDVQRLIGRLAEEKDYLSKQPGIIASQLESAYQQDVTDVLKQYMSQSMDIQGQEGQAKSDYAMSKFGYEQGQKDKITAAKTNAEQLYWDNYWKKRDLEERRWEVAKASGDKKAQLQAQASMKALDNQAKLDVANIRAGATISAASIRADATVTAASTRAGTPKPPTAAQLEKAKQSALRTVMRPDGLVRYIVKYGEKTVLNKINSSIRASGINPNSPQGKAIRAYVYSQISGQRVFGGGTYVKPKTP